MTKGLDNICRMDVSASRAWRSRMDVAACELALLILAASPLLALLDRIPHVCLFQYFLGIPCPGCGMTHSLIAALHGDWLASWRANPMGIPLAAGLIGRPFFRLAARLRPQLRRAVERSLSQQAVVFYVGLAVVWVIRVT